MTERDTHFYITYYSGMRLKIVSFLFSFLPLNSSGVNGLIVVNFSRKKKIGEKFHKIETNRTKPSRVEPSNRAKRDFVFVAIAILSCF